MDATGAERSPPYLGPVCGSDGEGRTVSSAGVHTIRKATNDFGFGFFDKYLPRLDEVGRVNGGLVGSVEMPDNDFCSGAIPFPDSAPSDYRVDIGPTRDRFEPYLASLPRHHLLQTRKKMHLSWHKTVPAWDGGPHEELGTYVLLTTPRGTPAGHMFLLLSASLSDQTSARRTTGRKKNHAHVVDFEVTVADYFVKPRHRKAGLMELLGHIGAVLAADAFEHLRSTLPARSKLNSYVAGDDRSDLAHIPPGEYLLSQFSHYVFGCIGPNDHRSWRGVKVKEVQSCLE